MGIILFKMLTNKFLYRIPDIEQDRGFYCTANNNIKMNRLQQYVSKKALCLLNGMLMIDEKQRMDISKVMKCEWLQIYYERYGQKLALKSKLQNIPNQKRCQFTKQNQLFPLF